MPELHLPPSLVVTGGAVTARLKPGALLWESESAVSRIPYGAIVGVTAEPQGPRGHSTVRIAVDDRALVFELVCRRQEASVLAAAIEQQLIAYAPDGSGVRPTVTTEPREEPAADSTGGMPLWVRLALGGLAALCVVESVALLLLGHAGRAVLAPVGFVLWVPGLVLAFCVFRLLGDVRRGLGPGVKLEARFVGLEWRQGASRPMLHEVYTVTGLDRAAHEYTRVRNGTSTTEPKPVRTVTALTDGSEIDTRLALVAGPLLFGFFCLVGVVVLVGLGFALVPGMLLW
ncbi:hypothetical protein ABH931_003985 [Streptacidiphilus sp. MAP12-33]|uniref:hypothetical protein n=1 Tax=Streptacidiphilus sp. MAP12-33 TaxID=3156266 RepID=UPI003516408B